MNKSSAILAVIIASVLIVASVAVLAMGVLTPVSGSTMQIEVWYEDGTHDTYKSVGTYEELSILVNNSPISYIIATVDGTITGPAVGAQYSETVTWNSHTAMQVELYRSGQTMPEFSSTADYTESGGNWVQGEEKQLAYYVFYASQLDDVVAPYGAGTWHMQINANTQVTTTYNGVTTTLAGGSYAGCSFEYSDGAASVLSIIVGASPYMTIQ